MTPLPSNLFFQTFLLTQIPPSLPCPLLMLPFGVQQTHPSLIKLLPPMSTENSNSTRATAKTNIYWRYIMYQALLCILQSLHFPASSSVTNCLGLPRPEVFSGTCSTKTRTVSIWDLRHKEVRSFSKGHTLWQWFVMTQTGIFLIQIPGLSALSHRLY